MKTEIIQIPSEHVNCYLLVNGDSAVLVDTGFEQDRMEILEKIKPYNVKLIVLTHGHIDHAQNALYFSNALGVPVAMHEKDAVLIENSSYQTMFADSVPGKALLELTRMNKGTTPPFKPDIYLKEGNTLDEFGIPATIIELPGHTQGSIGLDIENESLIVGDALFNTPPKPAVAIIYNEKDKAMESAKKIENLGERTIYFGHGSPKPNQKWT